MRLKGIRALGNARGFSVTIPHKVGGDSVPGRGGTDGQAHRAINTIVVEDGRLKGYNTDASGALRALKEGGALLDGHRVLILGSGGAARAIAFALATGNNIASLHDPRDRRGTAAVVRDLGQNRRADRGRPAELGHAPQLGASCSHL